jgi:hypothetical protein
MSIVLHVSKLSDKDDTCEVSESINAINLPRYLNPHKNDLTALEISIASSKYTLSGDDMTSNLSFESQGGKAKQSNDLENEIILHNQTVDRSSYVERIFNSSMKEEIGR